MLGFSHSLCPPVPGSLCPCSYSNSRAIASQTQIMSSQPQGMENEALIGMPSVSYGISAFPDLGVVHFWLHLGRQAGPSLT